MFTTGQRVIVRELAETPVDAIEKHIEVESMEAPQPQALTDRDVLIEVKSASVGWVDLLMTSGQYQHVPQPPYTPGLEYAGVVAWRGSAVTHVEVGDRVMNDGLFTGPR